MKPTDSMRLAIEQFVKSWETIEHEYYTKNLSNLPLPPFSINWGSKFAKVVVDTGSQKSVKGFIQLSNGDLLKAASWNAPAKHARGNIFNETHQVRNARELLAPNGFVPYLK